MGGFILGGGNGVADTILQNASSPNSLTDNLIAQNTIANSETRGAVDGADGTVLKVLGSESLFSPFTVFRYSEFGVGATNETPASYNFSRHRNTYTSSDILKIGEEFKISLEEKAKRIIENPSAINIIDWANNNAISKDHTGPLYPYPYQINDFLWCKWYGKIPNNKLLTLRRYPIPVEDNLAIDKTKVPLVPIAQAVTWWGEGTGNKLSEILGLTYGFNWEPISAEVSDIIGNEITIESVLDAAGLKQDSPARQALVASLTSINQNNPYALTGYDATLQQFEKDSWERGAYWNRVLGPVNVIDTTQMRKRGFTFENDITMDFEYNLRSYGAVNPKIAMLDLISNFLSLTYNTASFWGGAYRYFQNTGPLLDGFNTDAMEKGNYTESLKDVLALASNTVQAGGDALLKFATGIIEKTKGKNAEETTRIITEEAAKSSLAKNIVGSSMKGLHQKPLVLRALLDGRAVGEWHLMVGNPMDPFAVIGNLCMKTTTMTFSDELGADDFPVSIKFSVTLTHGRPRAKQDIESMFNHGGGGLSMTKIAPTSSEMNSFGEYNSMRLANAYGQNAENNSNVANTQFMKDLSSSIEAAKARSGANGTTSTAELTSQEAEGLASYFKTSVANKYGVGFGRSPILVDYFTQLKTKD